MGYQLAAAALAGVQLTGAGLKHDQRQLAVGARQQAGVGHGLETELVTAAATV